MDDNHVCPNCGSDDVECTSLYEDQGLASFYCLNCDEEFDDEIESL